MTRTGSSYDIWSLPTLLLWLVFFGVGLVPEEVMLFLGRTSHSFTVLPERARLVVTLVLSAYLALFVYRKCREASVSEAEAQAQGFRIGSLGLLAFLPFELPVLRSAMDIPVPWMRYMVLTVGLLKIVTWLYLMLLFVRYYGLGYTRVFVNALSVLPGAPRADVEVGESQTNPESAEAKMEPAADQRSNPARTGH
ncbi:MAG: hypothetical protein HY706_06435 [Candidatus Hydrogenedentes bacterium]|nr:hypothetical protein [Candidatus Hydrogenedentota bacterium]